MKYVIACPIRSGSTLLYNIVKNIFIDKPVIKSHHFTHDPDSTYLITIRHPYNSIISTLLKNKKTLNKSNLNSAIKEYLIGLNTFLKKIDYDNVIIFRYEKFQNNYDYIFDKLQKKLNVIITNREELNEKFSINNVKEYIKDFNEKNNLKPEFKNYDKKTHFHSNHISQYNGKTDYKVILKNHEDLLHILKTHPILNIFIKKYGY